MGTFRRPCFAKSKHRLSERQTRLRIKPQPGFWRIQSKKGAAFVLSLQA